MFFTQLRIEHQHSGATHVICFLDFVISAYILWDQIRNPHLYFFFFKYWLNFM